MLNEQKTYNPPGVPDFWRFGWMLFLQPLRFDTLFKRWDFTGSVSLRVLLLRSLAWDPIARAIGRHCALWLMVLMPAIAVLTAAIVDMLTGRMHWAHVACGLVGGLVAGIVVSFFDIRAGVVFGVVFGAVSGGAFGSAEIVPNIVPIAVAWIKVSLIGGSICGVLLLLLTKERDRTLAEHAIISMAIGALCAAAFFSVLCLPCGIAFAMMGGGVTGIPLGISCGAAMGTLCGFVLGGFGVAVGIVVGIVISFLLDANVGISFVVVSVFASSGRFFAPGLQTYVTTMAMKDESLGKALIEEATSSGNQTLVDLVLADLQAHGLEQAAAEQLFGRVVDMDFPFFPVAKTLVEDSPLRIFQAAAQDLAAGGTSYRRRKDAFGRARRVLESFRNGVASSEAVDSLSKRLLKTARIWIDMIDKEEHKIALAEAERPEVPPAFVAGSPLTPDRPEERDLFKGRRDMIKLIEHDLTPERGGALLIFGQRRMGKTSLRNYLPTFLGTGTTVLISDFQSLSGDPHRETPHRLILELISSHLPAAPTPPDSPRWGEALRWLQTLDKTLTDRSLLIVIDEVERIEDGIRAGWCTTDFLDFLRAAGDSLRRIRFLLLTAYPLHRLGPHWVDRLVSATSRSIAYLDETDARDLLCRPIPDFPDIYPEGGVDRILTETGRHPYLLQKVGDELCRLLNARGGRRKATAGELTEVFDSVVRGADLFDELWRQRTEDERATLRKLARAPEPIEPDPAALQLVREGYVERRGERVVIAVPLFREWIADTQG